MQKMASRAPAAPKQWPIIDLVEETFILYAWSPKAFLIMAVSAGSLIGVEVP